MRVLITGASGLIGQEIVNQCHVRNIQVHYLTTSKLKLENKTGYKGFLWNPKLGYIDTACFDGVEIVINLAGATIGKSWTPQYKKEILSRRVQAMRLIFDTIKEQNLSIKHIVTASAIGIYPDSLIHYYQESFTEFDNRFLSEVVIKWEKEASRFENLNMLVSKVRIGIVLSKKGGALSKLVTPVKYGFGSVFGRGDQWQSWIHIEDLACLFLFVIKNELEGVYNAVAPNSVKQKDFIQTLGAVLKRPIFLPAVPNFVLKFMLGEMSALILESQRVSSKKIESTGFSFRYHHLNNALENLFQK
jgi:uncharacterized protein (TIGR01777 family)